MGRDNPIISSLGVTETWGQKDADDNSCDQSNDDLDDNLLVGEKSVTTQNAISKTDEINTSTKASTETLTDFAKINGTEKVYPSVNKKKRILAPTDKTAEDTLDELKKRKMLQQIELLEKESYLKSLEVLKLERELQLPVSKFTEEFPSLAYIIGLEEAPPHVVEDDQGNSAE